MESKNAQYEAAQGLHPTLISKEVSQGEESRGGIASFIVTGTVFSFYAETTMLPFKTIFCSFSLIERQIAFHETLRAKAHKYSCQIHHLRFMILKVQSLKWAWDSPNLWVTTEKFKEIWPSASLAEVTAKEKLFLVWNDVSLNNTNSKMSIPSALSIALLMSMESFVKFLVASMVVGHFIFCIVEDHCTS